MEEIRARTFSYGKAGTGFPLFLSKEEYNRFITTKQFPITETTGTKIWLDKEGFLHRDNNMPAYCGKDNIEYRVHGKLHRTDGPAIIEIYGSTTGKRYYLDGKLMTKEKWSKALKIKVYFFAQKIKLLKKLIEIPENYDKVYYDNKEQFISLLSKI